MSQVAPRHAMAKSTLAALFAQDALPRRPGQLTAIVDVLTAELTEPADVSAGYLEAWTRLMNARVAKQDTPVLWPLLVGGTALSLVTWFLFAHGPVPFWMIWLAWCGPTLVLGAIAALFGQLHEARSDRG
jgi:hypothetical protein